MLPVFILHLPRQCPLFLFLLSSSTCTCSPPAMSTPRMPNVKPNIAAQPYEFERCTQPRTRVHEHLYRSSSLVQLLIYFSYSLVICTVYSLRRIMRSNWNINFYKILSSHAFNIAGIKISWCNNNVKPAVNSADDLLDRLHHRLTSRLELRATAFFASWNAFFYDSMRSPF